MPELPEVQTTVDDLRKKIVGLTIKGVWCNSPKQIHSHKSPSRRLTDRDVKQAKKNYAAFKKSAVGLKVFSVERKGKNILINLSQGKTILIHQKMTGHLLIGRWMLTGQTAEPLFPPAMVSDPFNRHVRLVLNLSSGDQLALADVRKFAKIILADTAKILELPDIKGLGPDALSDDLTLGEFSKIILNSSPTIKQALLKPEVISGIGNIYSDDILHKAKVHPLQDPRRLEAREVKRLYAAMRQVLKKAVKLRGTSTSDFRDTAGERGFYTEHRLVYQRKGQACQHCGKDIKRIKVGGRSAHFCLNCQKPKRIYAGKKSKEK